MWGSDYPHDEGTYPYSTLALRQVFHDWPEADLRKVLAENAAGVYDFDLDALAPAAASIGPTVARDRPAARRAAGRAQRGAAPQRDRRLMPASTSLGDPDLFLAGPPHELLTELRRDHAGRVAGDGRRARLLRGAAPRRRRHASPASRTSTPPARAGWCSRTSTRPTSR